ncbi:1030_t:CDS:2 [Rhizophagus irregularis]|nr:1030_t:CDS:2 [Rhizophagus irregularis]
MMVQFTQGYKTDREYRGVKFVVQCKNFTQRKVNGSLVRDFIGGLSNYPPDTLGIFVTSTGCSQSSLELAENTITIENAEIENIEVEEGSTLSLFGN